MERERERELFLRVEPFVRRVSSHLDFNVADEVS